MPPIDLTSELGLRAQELWQTAEVIWLTTIRADGSPWPNPVWFVWDGEEFVIYSRPGVKAAHVRRDPRVTLHLNGEGWDRDIIVADGEARIAEGEPPVEEARAYLVKYGALIDRLGMTLPEYSRTFSVPIRIRPLSLRGH